MSKMFKINANCIGCGMCYAQYPNFFAERNDGTAKTIEGKLIDENVNTQNIVSVCPNGVIEIISVTDDKKQLAMAAVHKLEAFKGCPIPTKKEIHFESSEYYVERPHRGPREYEAIFSSSGAADRGALDDFIETMYSKVDNILLKIMTQYRTKYLRKYFTKNKNDGSVYAEINEKISEILMEIKNIVGSKLPDDYAKVEVDYGEDFDLYVKFYQRGEILTDELVNYAKKEFDYKASSYDCYWDTDSRDVMVRSYPMKFKEKYYYDRMDNAYQELAKDILFVCHLADNDIEESAIYRIKCIVNIYNEKLKELLNKKIELAKKALNNMN